MVSGWRGAAGGGSAGDRLLLDFDLGTSDYEFRSASGTDYTYYARDRDGWSSAEFVAAGGAEVLIVISPDRRLYPVVDGDDVGETGYARAGEIEEPLGRLIAAAVADLNAESSARRDHRRAVLEAAGSRVPTSAPLPTPGDRLRSDFDLGPENFEFTSARGWAYEYVAEDDDGPPCVILIAPSGSRVFMVFVVRQAGWRREVRVAATVDGVDVADSPLLTVDQFPEPVQWLFRDAFADLNEESVRRGERQRGVAGRPGPQPPPPA